MEVVGLVGGALLGAVAGELLKEVLKAKHTINNFRLIFERLESTLNTVIPQINAIIVLNCKLDIQQDTMEEFKLLAKHGKSLILECSQASSISYAKKLSYGKKLLDLNKTLKEYFHILLPLDHFRNTLEVLKLVRDLHTKLATETSSDDSHTKLACDASNDDWSSDSVYQKKVGTCLFLLKGCSYELDTADFFNCEGELLRHGKYTSTRRYDMKFGKVVMKKLTGAVKMNKREFQERMEEIGKIGKHPNIILPFGYFCSDIHQYLLYDHADAGSFAAYLKEPITFRTRPDWNNKLKIVLGVAKGINYMHSEGGVVHGNIKSFNVLLTRDLNGCISDFGLDPIMHLPEIPSSKARGKFVPKCPAPELKFSDQATQQSDVYNFGVMLFEIISLYKNVLRHPNVFLEQVKIALIARKCTNKDREKRPKMDDVVKMIEKAIST